MRDLDHHIVDAVIHGKALFVDRIHDGYEMLIAARILCWE
jgi:hypothetical protein